MAKVHIVNVACLDNPSPFSRPFQFEITFECLENLQEDLEWKIIYVGSAQSEEYDQVLDSVLVGPIPGGRHMFVFQADPPDTSKIPQADIIGVTVVLITCSYKGHEFVRVGYYVNIEYMDPELRENPPSAPDFQQVQRNILTSQPRVTKFNIDWDEGVGGGSNAENSENLPPQDLNCFPIESNHFGPTVAPPSSSMMASSKPGVYAISTDSVDGMDTTAACVLNG